MVLDRLQAIGSWGCQNSGVEEFTDLGRLDKHATKATTEEHDRDGDMLEILCSPSLAPGCQVFKPHIGRTVEEDDERFDEFGGRYSGFASADQPNRRLHVPSPSHLRKASHPSSKSEETIPEEDSALNGMCKPVKDINAPLFSR